mmetsp:Transcript_21147/g.59152  ORF Transcript_21147/g.59152 Transcript_21147/m.59152 type:complete len:309 (+) Transcript_21147:564-1490(+)
MANHVPGVGGLLVRLHDAMDVLPRTADLFQQWPHVGRLDWLPAVATNAMRLYTLSQAVYAERMSARRDHQPRQRNVSVRASVAGSVRRPRNQCLRHAVEVLLRSHRCAKAEQVLGLLFHLAGQELLRFSCRERQKQKRLPVSKAADTRLAVDALRQHACEGLVPRAVASQEGAALLCVFVLRRQLLLRQLMHCRAALRLEGRLHRMKLSAPRRIRRRGSRGGVRRVADFLHQRLQHAAATSHRALLLRPPAELLLPNALALGLRGAAKGAAEVRAQLQQAFEGFGLALGQGTGYVPVQLWGVVRLAQV